jgi:Flp pilus assembly protein TadG
MPRRRLIDRDRGVSSLELAFIAPSLIALIFFVIQAALFFYGRSVAQDAAREAVSRLRLDQTQSAYDGNHTAIEKEVAGFAHSIGSGALEVDKVTTVYDDAKGTVTVTVTGTAISLTGIDLHITETVTGRIERFQDLS